MRGKKRLRKGLMGFVFLVLMFVNTVWASETSEVKVHFRVPETWENYDEPQIYYYDAQGSESIAWPGDVMAMGHKYH